MMDSPIQSNTQDSSRSSTPMLTSPLLQQQNKRNSPRDFVIRFLSPKIAVISSKDADQVCQANNIPDFYSLLKPFGDRIEGRVTARDSQGLSNTLENFTIRFAHLLSLEQPNVDTLSQAIAEKIKSFATDNNNTLNKELPIITSKSDVTEDFLELNQDDITPWYAEYRRQYFTFTGASEHETFDHPVACIIAVSSSNPDPVKTANELFNNDNPAPIYEKGFMDPNLLKCYVLLHDNYKVSFEHSQMQFDTMRRSFKTHCYQIKLNPILQAIPSDDPFPEIGDFPPPQIPYGQQYLSGEDIIGIQSFVRELVKASIIPHMERNIQTLNEQVASSRRGITGRLFSASKRYFGTGSKSANQSQQQQLSQSFYSEKFAIQSNNPINDTLVRYHYNSPEAQMRKLADYAFMLRDYKFAYSIYDTVKKDFSADKEWKYSAGAQEMIGICLLIALTKISSRIDIDHHFEQAVNSYLNILKMPFYATKSTLLYFELLKYRGLYKDAPSALVRVAGEDSDLRSALFLEQAAYAFLRCQIPMVRKYAFHLIMAGHRYAKCNQVKRTIPASNVFKDHFWSLAEDHIHFALGKQSFHLGKFDKALKYYLKLLRTSRQSPNQQNTYLKEFLTIYKPDFVSQELKIPIIKDSLVKIVLSNSQCSEYDEIWEGMEKEYLEETYVGIDEFNKYGKKPSILKNNICQTVGAVGEYFFVHITLENPMQNPINLNEITLECEHISQSNDENNSTSINELMTNEDKTQPSKSTNIGEPHMKIFDNFDLEILPEVSLDALEKKTISLRVLPKKRGTLKVLGLRYSLNSLVNGMKKFNKRGKRLDDTKENRINVTYTPDKSLELMVASPMPLLEVDFHSFPEILLSGEVNLVVLEVNNKGQKGLKNLRVKMSHPSFFCIGEPEILEKTLYDNDSEVQAVNELKASIERLRIKNSFFDSKIRDIPLPLQNGANGDFPSFALAPGKNTLIPIWVRGDKIGKYMFRFLFIYESEDNDSVMSYRSLRYFRNTQVQQSLKVNSLTRPSARGSNEFILCVEVENLQTRAEFHLYQFSSISPLWTVSPVNKETR
ncbi:10537_t:CDS:10 [Entrophospora sp. SA101]|nr:10537_t:CDS:10 [Entrophospora sp. SA101]